MAQGDNPLMVVVKGGLAGAIGTAVLTVAMQRGPQLLEQFGVTNSASGQKVTEPTEKLSQRVLRGVTGKSLKKGQRETAGEAIHWVYGTAWGALYGIVQASLRPRHWLHGTLLGVVTASLAATVVPAMQLAPAATEQPASASLSKLGAHLIYGWATALAFRYLAKDA